MLRVKSHAHNQHNDSSTGKGMMITKLATLDAPLSHLCQHHRGAKIAG